MAAERRPRSRPAAPPSFSLREHLRGGAVGRPKHHDDEALYRMRQLVERDGLPVRAAARRVAAERGYPDFKAKTFEEWARKEYATRQRQDSLPPEPPLTRLETGLESIFRRQDELVAEARLALRRCRERAPQLGVDLSRANHGTVRVITTEVAQLDELATSSPEFLHTHFAAQDKTKVGILERVREALRRRDELLPRLDLIKEYLWATKVLEQAGFSPDVGKNDNGAGEEPIGSG